MLWGSNYLLRIVFELPNHTITMGLYSIGQSVMFSMGGEWTSVAEIMPSDDEGADKSERKRTTSIKTQRREIHSTN
jgi:hypothetical protein